MEISSNKSHGCNKIKHVIKWNMQSQSLEKKEKEIGYK